MVISDAKEHDEINSITSEDDFNWLCQKGNYGPLPSYSDNSEKVCQQEDALAKTPSHRTKHRTKEGEEDQEADIAFIRDIVDAIVFNCFCIGRREDSKSSQRQNHDPESRSIAAFESRKLFDIRFLAQ